MERLWVDFNNMGHDGVRLICNGTLKELLDKKIDLCDGLQFLIWDDDEDFNGDKYILCVEAIVKYSSTELCWVAQYEEGNLKREDIEGNQ